MPLAIMIVPDTTEEKKGSARAGILGNLEESFMTSSLWCKMIHAGTQVIMRMKFQMMVSPANMLKKEIVNFPKLFPRGMFCIDILCSLFDL